MRGAGAQRASMSHSFSRLHAEVGQVSARTVGQSAVGFHSHAGASSIPSLILSSYPVAR